MELSILICTYNNCESLKDTLNSLLKQHGAGDIDYEVLVVDNNSTDKTRAVVESYIERFSGRLHYAFENKMGLPFARNKGIRDSKGEIIAFTDDDCIPDRNYIYKIFKTFNESDENIKFIGGKINPKWLSRKRPQWLRDYFFGPLAILDYGEKPFIVDVEDLVKRRLFVGANFAFKRSVFDKYGLFKTKKIYAQDTEMCLRLLAAGAKGLYNPDIIVNHKISSDRMQKDYFYQWCYRRGKMRALDDEIEIKAFYPLGMLLWLCFRMTKDCINSLFIKSEYETIKHKCFFFTHLGMITQIMKNNLVQIKTEIRKIKCKVESKRESKTILWRVIVSVKDFLWIWRPERLTAEFYLIFRGIKNNFFIKFNVRRLNLQKNSNVKLFVSEPENSLKEIISNTTGYYCLLDIPNHGNIGDHLICQGEIDFLKKFSLKEKYRASYDFFNNAKIGQNDLIFFNGGGNFGDLYRELHVFREKIIETFKDNKIIIFPQSVYFRNEKNLRKSVAIFSKHKNVTICARDKFSFNFLKKHFCKNAILLVPDMAFYIDLSVMKQNRHKINKVLYLNRTDKERKESLNLEFIKNLEVYDWPTYEIPILESIPQKFKYRNSYILEGISFLAKYDLIISNRLHGSVLASKLGISNILLDNIYGKNKNFYNTWMKDLPHCFFAKDREHLEEIIRNHFNEIVNERKK